MVWRMERQEQNINSRRQHPMGGLTHFTSETSCLTPAVFCKYSYHLSGQLHFVIITIFLRLNKICQVDHT